MLAVADKNRASACTNLNDHSSRRCDTPSYPAPRLSLAANLIRPSHESIDDTQQHQHSGVLRRRQPIVCVMAYRFSAYMHSLYLAHTTHTTTSILCLVETPPFAVKGQDLMVHFESPSTDTSSPFFSRRKLPSHRQSHLILSVSVRGVNRHTGATSAGRLHLIDLAGSERISKVRSPSAEVVCSTPAVEVSRCCTPIVHPALDTRRNLFPSPQEKKQWKNGQAARFGVQTGLVPPGSTRPRTRQRRSFSLVWRKAFRFQRRRTPTAYSVVYFCLCCCSLERRDRRCARRRISTGA